LGKHKTSGQLSHKALSDTTKYDALEVAHASTDDTMDQLLESVKTYYDKIDAITFCVVMVISKDPLLVNLKRRKFYCWPWLPSPRPNQAVFLYNKMLDKITKRLWVLPCPETMAYITEPGFMVGKEYQTMQHWSRSFYRGTFWKDIRDEHKIDMLSQEEYFALHADELANSGLYIEDPGIAESFDFSKIQANNFDNSTEPVIS